MFRARPPNEQDVKSALQSVQHSHGIDIASQIENILIQDRHIIVTLNVDAARAKELEPLRRECEIVLRKMKGIDSARVILTAEQAQAAAKPKAANLLPQVKHVIAVASGKGGVGKSTVAANLAVALGQSGLRVGLLDADIYGPSAPTLLGTRTQKPEQVDDKLIPVEAYGIKMMSMGFLVPEEQAMIWRGPMIQSALLQMLRDVDWGELDVLVLDLPPGTGDTQLTIAQRLTLSGAVIVSTPQDLALLDAMKAVQMFQKTAVPVLGIVENMSLFCCPSCGTETPIFGHGGAKQRAQELNFPFLGELPLDPTVRQMSDQGQPIVLDQGNAAAKAFHAIAEKVASALDMRRQAPKIIIEA